jgi:archaellum component FlaC
MGALKDAFEAYEEKITDLTNKVNELETELKSVHGRYEDLCAVLRKKANEERNEDYSSTDYNDGDFY